MKDEILHAWGAVISTRIENILREKEDLEHLLNVLGKPYTEEQPKVEKPTSEEINSLKTTVKVSDKGPYDIISKAENSNNPAFQKLQSYIKKHNGFVILHGFKFWEFSNNSDLLGRRKN